MDFNYILSVIFLLPLLGSLIVYFAGSRKEDSAKLLSLVISGVVLVVTIVAAWAFLETTDFLDTNLVKGLFPNILSDGTANNNGAAGFSVVLVDQITWVESIGITYFLGIDGLSAPLMVLTSFVTMAAIFASPKKMERGPLYYSLILLLETGIFGTFMALDFFLFFVSWELVLVPMFFLIGIWGGPKREYAAIYFFIYTHLASLVLLLGVVGMWVLNVGEVGFDNASFSMLDIAVTLQGLPIDLIMRLIFGAMFFGFIVKVPTAPFHTWLPLAHVEAPSPISMVLAGLLLKMGGYGLIRINFIMLPQVFEEYALAIALLGILSLFWGGFVALRQVDLKRLVAYSSIAHMGMVLFGAAISAATGRPEGLIGAQYMMIAHGLISPMLFNICGVVQHTANTRDIPKLRGLTQKMPNLAGLLVFASMASLGLPGLAGFVSEFFTFLAAFGWNQNFFGVDMPWLAFVAIIGIVVTVAYYLWMLQRVVWGQASETVEAAHPPERWEYTSLFMLAVPILVLGILPMILINPIWGTFEAIAALTS